MWKKYKKTDDFTYAFGVAPSIECLKYRPKQVIGVIINPKGRINEGVRKISEMCKTLNIPVEENQKLIEKLSQSENTYAMAIVTKYRTHLDSGENHLVLLNPSDMGNLGTICRTMLGLDFVDLAIIVPAADIFDPKTIRASMGAVFSLNIGYFSSLGEYLRNYQRQAYIFTGDGANEIGKTTFMKPYSLVFGNEGAGIVEKYRTGNNTVKLYQSDKIDSYNLSVSIGISLYCARTRETDLIQ